MNSDGQTGLKTLEKYAPESASAAFALASSDFCKSMIALSQAGVIVNDYEQVKANANLKKALAAAYGYLNSGHFGWNRAHGHHGKDQTYRFIKNLMAREDKDLSGIRTEMQQWVKGYGPLSRSSGCHGFSRVGFAHQSELFGQAATPFFEMGGEDRKAVKEKILTGLTH
ncbi:hypothetical protein Psal006b_01316 [Piscirickettsia salmonis]|uniref:Uncharacterized protein n=1 Tax=Piscirickettsia salmonis TaxID=1238 RepID=A0A1L6TCG4_PISSA|nr:hypothetical protein [Piscirickettsia salmonis]AKP74186.2 hypothetical protein PSLF89_2525 [Piscirickettsia salmonis LF-89 = ATCC VR-1361]ALB23069.1 hypothetical protein KU39_1889 [Piscirickettsia salmonis]ALY03005.1 hypothetical protein AWE47_09250 [Piscirickettsia salmonis]AMA42563.1 hypothetical protein AWJ11_09455 [Piscirickettsia salmonis]AOS35033.1 hypothetical protein AVM72_06595 [Piscirickettsia salmonis]